MLAVSATVMPPPSWAWIELLQILLLLPQMLT